MMWEYKIEPLYIWTAEGKVNELNSLGAIGWELVAVSEGYGYLKRLIKITTTRTNPAIRSRKR